MLRTVATPTQTSNRTFNEIISSWGKSNSDNSIIFYEGRSISTCSYQELYLAITKRSQYLTHIGISKGDRILFPFESGIQCIISFFALMKLGALPFSIKPYGIGGNKEAYLQFISKIATNFEIQYIFETPSNKKLECPIPTIKLEHTFNIETHKSSKHEYQAQPEDIAFIQFSSGSTSFPKGIPITHEKLMQQLEMITRQAQATSLDITASWLPLYHDMGLVGGLLAPLYQGQTLHLQTPRQFLLDPIQWLQLLSREQVNYTVIPDFALGYILRRIEASMPDSLAQIDLNPLKLIFNGSEPIDVKTLIRFREKLEPYGLKEHTLKPCYGMAETVLMVSCTHLSEIPKIHVLENGCFTISLGCPLPEYDLRITHPNGNICAEEEIGEIEIKEGSLAKGYFESDRTFYNAEGYYATGDFGFLKNGQLYVTGRIKDRCKINGQNYFATDFEQAISEEWFGQPGKVACIFETQNPSLLIEVKPRDIKNGVGEVKDLTIRKVIERVGIKLKSEQIHLIYPNQLPKTSSGKLRRIEIADMFARQDFRVIEEYGFNERDPLLNSQ